MKRRYLLPILFVALAVASCGEPTAVAPPPSAGQPEEGLIGNVLQATGLLRCDPLPYDSVTQVVGWWGGTIDVGPHRLHIPFGALDHQVTITAVIPANSTTNLVQFQPHGLEFDRSAYLTMSYANCSGPITLLPKQVAYVNDLLDILNLLPSLDNLWQKRVTGRVDHFSGYAIAW